MWRQGAVGGRVKGSKAAAKEEQEEKKLLVGVAMSTVAIGIAKDR
jgi:hypothetical protein